jgi:hypothetical protein
MKREAISRELQVLLIFQLPNVLLSKNKHVFCECVSVYRQAIYTVRPKIFKINVLFVLPIQIVIML